MLALHEELCLTLEDRVWSFSTGALKAPLTSFCLTEHYFVQQKLNRCCANVYSNACPWHCQEKTQTIFVNLDWKSNPIRLEQN